jgi:hypothetical protein
MIKPEITTKDEAKQSLEALEATFRSVYEHRYGREELTAVLGPAFNEIRRLKAYIDTTTPSEQAE